MTPADLETMRAEHEATFGDAACPKWVKDSLQRYVEHGIPTGDCLRAVLANDMQGAFGRADVDTARAMAAIVGYVYRHIPRGIIGSYSDVDEYSARKRDERRARDDSEGRS